jgi:hypothetical protein
MLRVGLFLSFYCFIISSFAQEGYWMTGGTVGVNSLRADYSPNFDLNSVGASLQGQWLYGINKYLRLRNQVGAGYLRSSTQGQGDPILQAANQSFNSFSFSIGTGIQYEFLPYRNSNKDRKGSPYLFSVANLNYTLGSQAFSPGIDFGLGYKKSIGYFWDVVFEISTSRLLLDNLDGIRKEEIPSPLADLRNDRISFLSVGLVYHYIRVRCP